MSFAPVVPGGEPTGLAPVEYRLARNAVVSEYRKGRLSRRDVCDAHPELMRAARNVGVPTGDPCPICAEGPLVHVSFAFGANLPPGGRCLTSLREIERLSRRRLAVTCYVVEVCPECSWNHLARVHPLRSRL